MISRRLFWLGFAAALLTAFGCGGGGGGEGTPSHALACSDGGAAASDAVTMTCAGATNGTTEQVNVVIGGTAAGTTTLRGLNFDVTYDTAKLVFVPAASYASPLFSPNALVAVTLFNGQQGRVVVSIQAFGGSPAVTVGSGQHVVLSLSFRIAPGATFSAAPLPFENTEATTASAAISFGSSLSLSYQ